ncbi:hypothetical protein HNP55_003831 [Paucibacter oligotrophus]|uniref:Transferrin-binding protein B C-lobe/N-lobe beta barrel domain-containing protein n=1 Tax=Roseateles oligotrophus TaxID=1769250 RepID=A0A840L9N1_9BURK|nr:Slam-dependent surface lipoprotein [Roseateles oligotrophus]MBB4845284.1 hypothetical protein [Roseateles oligotrophus]
MKKHVLAVALSFAGVSTFAATVEGDSSDLAKVKPGQSTLFGSANAGLSFNNTSTVIDLAGGPVLQVSKAIARGVEANGKSYIKGRDVNFLAGILLGDKKIAQVWHNEVSHDGASTSIHSARQMIVPPLPFMPNFGGLVIGKVQGSAVYFGEWSPKGANFADVASTDLNMGSAERTAWYSGENPTKSMPTLVNAQYKVVGIHQHKPESPNVYSGVLTASYASGGGDKNILTGSLTRGASTLAFNDVLIKANGTFDNLGSTKNISGQFYNNANALAGIYKTGTAAKDGVAFGGARR